MSDPAAPVQIGSVVFALIEPTPGHEDAFHRWYDQDHYYRAGTAAPGVFSASRYVAPRWCRDLRRPSDAGVAGDPARGSCLALYLVLAGHDDDRIAWATAQTELAVAEGRVFAEREHLHTWSYSPDWSWVASAGGVTPALALDRRYAGVTVVLVDVGEGVSPSAIAPTLREQWSGHDDPVPVVLALAPSYEVMPSTWIGPIDPSRRRAFLCFHDGDPVAGWEASRGRFDGAAAAGLLRVVWASPFVVDGFDAAPAGGET